MLAKISDKQAEIERLEKRFDKIAKYYSWIIGIALGALISYITYTL